MELHYGDRWFHARKRSIDVLDEDTARARHAAHQPYTVVVGSLERPTHVISFASPWVSVGFFDASRREYLSYDFKETGTVPESLFLKMAEFREFKHSDKPVASTRFAYAPSGRLLIERQDLETGETLEREQPDDLSENWEDYPTFGSYASLCRAERLPATRSPVTDHP